MSLSSKKYHSIVFGCQMNERDSEYINGTLENLGYEKTNCPEDASIVFLNTCCIREKAENKALSMLGELRKQKAMQPDLIIGVSGCMPQQKGKAKKIQSSMKYVDIILGTHNLHELEGMLQKVLSGQGQQMSVWEEEGDVVEGLHEVQAYPFKSLINIVYGCNNFCTYCIVPFVRGRERSRKPEEIIKEIEKKAANGVKEVMLLGQNVNSYGKDFMERSYFFSDLILALKDVEGLERIRYMTSHPRDFTDQLLEAIAANPKVTDHFHLPVQSGSNPVLRKMNRGYTREYYLDLVKKIRKIRPEAAITTDIIVGFPGETDEDFAQTMELVEKVRFVSAFTFMFSPRKGTPAYDFPDQVPLAVKKERIQTLNRRISELEVAYHKKLKNRVLNCLIEGKYKEEGKLTGKTSAYRNIVVEGPESLIGTIVPVLVTHSTKILKGTLSLPQEINPSSPQEVTK